MRLTAHLHAANVTRGYAARCRRCYASRQAISCGREESRPYLAPQLINLLNLLNLINLITLIYLRRVGG
ncbi:MAG: hypothetical protein K2L93_08075 [Muribaculaceae bacterium]|nr:hypothetical protein [Muribaculaceae bacterium]